MIRTVVVDESPLFRRQLVIALERATDVEVMAEAADADSALARVLELAPDVVFLTPRIPPLGGIRLASAIRESLPAVELAFILSADDEAGLGSAIRAGATGFLPRDGASAVAPAVARALNGGRPVLTAKVAEAVLEDYEAIGSRADGSDQLLRPPVLSDGARQVLDQLVEMRTLGEAARALGISAATAANRVRCALEQLHRFGRSESLVAQAH